MAIPPWLTNPELVGSPSASQPDFGQASETFGVLSNPVRLEILGTLHEQAAPMQYAELLTELSVRDNGRLNYHLRQLDGLVANDDGVYTLTDRGERLIQEIATEDVWDA